MTIKRRLESGVPIIPKMLVEILGSDGFGRVDDRTLVLRVDLVCSFDNWATGAHSPDGDSMVSCMAGVTALLSLS
jgi:hypothetical protein